MHKCPDDIERLAKLIAFWHGQKVQYIDRLDGKITVAAARLRDHSGYPDVTDRYVDGHWQEYTSAAEQVKEHFNAARETNSTAEGQP